MSVDKLAKVAALQLRTDFGATERRYFAFGLNVSTIPLPSRMVRI